MDQRVKNLHHIRRIDLELQSFCNRKCDWCPNKVFDRSFKEVMPDDVFTSLVNQLKEADFGKDNTMFFPDREDGKEPVGTSAILSFLGYQESFSDPELLLRRINEARSVLDDRICYITNTNGDYLTKENLEHMLLTNIAIQDYDNKGLEYWKQRFKELGILAIGYDKNLDLLHGIHRYAESVTVQLNWSKNIKLENRGGFFKQGDLPQYEWAENMEKRTRECPEPEYFITIAYDGSVMPCCHMRPDNPAHKEYILGNIKDTPLVDIYYSEKAEKIREKLRVRYGDYPEPCKYCQKKRYINCYGSPSGWNYVYGDFEKEELERTNNKQV